MERVLVIICCVLSIFGCSAQEVFAPDYAGIQPIERTKTQKAIGVSTDVTLIALPAAALATVLIKKDWQGLKQGVFTGIAAVGSMVILKYSVRELRPDHSNFHSFPSGHSTSTFAAAGFLQRRYGWKFGIPAYAVATYTAVGRVAAKKHHWWDVVAGAAIGVGSAYIFTKPWAKKHDFSLVPVADDTTVGFTASLTL